MINITDMRGRCALVTGASSGLGAHFAKVLAAAGARVALCARREAKLAGVAQAIRATGGECMMAKVDVTDAASITANGDLLRNIDVLVNNAGFVHEATAFDVREDDWDAVIDTNLKGMFLMAQAVGEGMKERGSGGSIINIASILGLRQAGGVVSYAVSKAGVIQLTKSLALEWARWGIRVNALAPGYIETALNADFWSTDAGKALVHKIPQRRLGRPDDLDGPLLLLASQASAYMTGSVLAVDGGHLVSSL